MTQNLNRTLFIADNLPVLRGIDSESVDLIATDPPFNKGVKAFEGITTAGENISYKDVWTWSDVQQEWWTTIREEHRNLYEVIDAANHAAGDDMGAFLCWLGVRVLEMQFEHPSATLQQNRSDFVRHPQASNPPSFPRRNVTPYPNTGRESIGEGVPLINSEHLPPI